jgi:hypothetical protein
MAKKKKDRYHSVEKILEELQLEKTGQIRPIKETKKKKRAAEVEEARSNGKLPKYILRIFLLLLILYAVIFFIGFGNDMIYKGELDKIKVEDETYYQSIFPVQKDWLPDRWELKECNSWDTYVTLFPPKSDETGKAIPDEQYIKEDYVKNILKSPYLRDFDKIAGSFAYESSEDLRNILDNYGKNFKLEALFAALKCKEVDAHSMIKANRTLYRPMVIKYADMVTLKARADFLEGNTEEGLSKIHDFMVFCLDLLSSSTSLAQDRMAATCFKKTCRELIPLLISFKLNLESEKTLTSEEQGTPAIEEQDQSVPENQDVAAAAAKQQTSPQEKPESAVLQKEEDLTAEVKQKEPEDFDSPLFGQIKNLVKKTLEKIEPTDILKKEYRGLGRNYENMYDTIKLNKPEYYLYGKFNYWNHWFSINRYFFDKGAKFYKDLFEGLKYIENTRQKSAYIINYYDKHKTGNNIITPDIPQICCEINNAGMFGKLVLILLEIREYGLNSIEFSNLKATPVFINEFSGKPFEIEEGEAGFSILLKDTSKLNLSISGYREGHKQILQSFRQFDIKSEERIREIYKSSNLH